MSKAMLCLLWQLRTAQEKKSMKQLDQVTSQLGSKTLKGNALREYKQKITLSQIQRALSTAKRGPQGGWNFTR
jgi:hypothetical protein